MIHVDNNPTPGPIAAIDIGATAIRMVVAQVGLGGRMETLESLSRAVDLGRDTFTSGRLARPTIESCVKILGDYRRVLDEYGVDDPDRIRVVATTAVQEAENGLTFIDRVLIATGLHIQPIDPAEVNRLTFIAIHPLLQAHPALGSARLLVAEVSGGATELLLLDEGHIVSTQTHRFGSLRVPELAKSLRGPSQTTQGIIENHVRRTVDRVRREIEPGETIRLLALGGEARFAATQIQPGWEREGLAELEINALERLTNRVFSKTLDQLVVSYELSYQEAETLGPALQSYLELARAYGLGALHVCAANLRDGLLGELASGGVWSSEFRDEIIRSAVEWGRRFGFHEAHGRHTARLAQTLFEALQPWHELDVRFELLLYTAALLHDVGNVINKRSHHKHSMYLILNSELFGLGRRDLLLVALVARYHRRALPRPNHEGYATLSAENRIAVAKMAAILRVADALDRSDSQRIADISCRFEDGRMIILVSGVDDLSLEQLGLQQKGTLFEDVFGMSVLLRRRA